MDKVWKRKAISHGTKMKVLETHIFSRDAIEERRKMTFRVCALVDGIHDVAKSSVEFPRGGLFVRE